MRCTGAVAVAPETCAECGFDGTRWDLPDILGTLPVLGALWREAAEGIDEDVLRARPAPDVWSAAEYADHSADIVRIDGLGLAILLAGEDMAIEADDVDVPTPSRDARFEDSVDRLDAELATLHRLVAGAPGAAPGWSSTLTTPEGSVDAGWLLRHVVHDVTHHLMDIGRGLQRLGAGAPTQAGRVAQLNVSDGGVPKTPVTAVEVDYRGAAGDRQATRRHHGRPFQALCLWSAEVIEGLQAEGHPIAAGAAGENVTLAGIDWATLRPGTRIRIGEVLAELSAWSTPCQQNARWFADRDFRRIDHERHPGWSRVYAWVREPGRIRTGDAAVVEP